MSYPNTFAAQTGPLALSTLDANFNWAIDIQSQAVTAAAGGTADALTATYTPAVTSLINGLTLYVRASAANATTTPQFSPNGLTARTIVKASGALAIADIYGAGHWLQLQYDTTLVAWVLSNPATTITKGYSQIQPITASATASALTVTLNPCTLDFRATPLTSGTVNTRTVATAISMVVPSTATLGTVSATQSRIVVLAIDNAGTIELAVVNISGGSVLDETTLITTTAIAAASNSATAYYSTTARTSVAYRVVGYIESTQATAGTWATAPSTIQGYGGQALAAMSSLGYGQTWQTQAKSFGVTYYNTSGKPIQVSVIATATAAASTMSFVVGGLSVSRGWGGNTTDSEIASFPVTIPVGTSYSASITTGTATLVTWYELR